MMEAFNVFASMSLVDAITGPLRAVQASLAATGRGAERLSARMGALARSMAPIAAVAGMLLLGLGSTISVAADFEAAISGVGAVASATTQEMELLRQTALDLGGSTAWSASQVAEAEKYLAMAGFSVAENVAALPGVLDLASAGATDLGRAADIASDILSGFGLEAAQMGRVADVLAKTATTANTNLEMLGDTMKYVAPVARMAGLSLEETSAMAGMLANIGIKSSQGGTALRTMLSRLASPAGEASRMLETLGVSVLDAAGDMRSPVVVLGELSNAMDGLGSGRQIQALETLFGVEAMTGAAEIIRQQGLGSLREYVGVLETSAGTAAEVAGRQLDNLQGEVTLLSSAWESLQISIGSIFLPVLRPLVQGISAVVSALARLAQTPVGRFLVGVLAAVSLAVVAFTGLAAAAWAVSAAVPFLTASLAPLAAAVAAISWPVWLVVAAVGALYLAWRNNFGGMADALSRWWGSMSLIRDGVLAVLASLQDGVGVIRGQLADDIQAAGLLGLVSTIARVAYRIGEFWTAMTGALAAAWNETGTILEPVFAALVEGFGAIFELIGLVTTALFGASAATDASGWRTLGRVVGFVVGTAFKVLAAAIRIAFAPLELFFRTLRKVVDFIKSVNLAASGRAMMTTLAEGIRSALSAPMEMVRNALSAVRDLLPFSDAREGPLSALTASGRAVMHTLGRGIEAAAPQLARTTAAALGGVALATGGPPPATGANVPAPRIEVQAPVPATASGRTTIIQRLEVRLNGVRDADDFLKRLQGLVERHDG